LPAPRSSHSDKTAKVAAEFLPLCAAENPEFQKSRSRAEMDGRFPTGAGGNTGLSMELSAVSLRPIRSEEDSFEHSPHKAVASVRHCLDFGESESYTRSPKISRKCPSAADDDHPQNCDSTLNGCALLATTDDVDCDRDGLSIDLGSIQASTPVSSEKSQRNGGGDLTEVVTPVAQKFNEFAVCF